MTAINLGLRNRYGYVLWGNSLAGECKLGYRTGMNPAGGFIRHMRPGELVSKLPVPQPDDSPVTRKTIEVPTAAPTAPPKQLHLF